jgi:PAS domain S-box-containing protein
MDQHGASPAEPAPGGLLDDIDAVIWEADARTAAFRYISPSARRVTGWAAEEWVSRPSLFVDHLHPDDRENVLALLLAAAEAPIDVEHRFLMPDGTVRWLHTTARVAEAQAGDARTIRGMSTDVTARHRAEQERREAETRFRRVVERMPAIVYLEAADPGGDGPGEMLYVSPQVQDLLGFAPEEWVAEPGAWARQFHPDDRERVRAIFEQVAHGEGLFVAEYRMFTRDGRVRWFHDEALLIKDEAGTPMFWQGVMHDITVQRENEALVRGAEERFRALVEQLPAIVYSENVTDDGLQMVYINQQVRQLLGIEPEEWLADSTVWSKAIHPDDVEAVTAENRRTEMTGEPFSTEYRMIARDGHIVWFKDEARLITDENGEPGYWQGIMIDITGHRQAEAQLAEAESRYRALVEQTPSITYVAAIGDGAGVLYISPQCGSVVGYTPSEWYADPELWRRIVHPDDIGMHHPDPSAGEHSARYRLVAKDGRAVWVHDRATLIADEQGQPLYWQGVLVDITEQLRAESLEHDLATERLTSEQLREADALKSTFLQAVSHDLRSPLAAILGLARTLERDDLELPADEARDLAGRIAVNARRLDRMVADLLDLERLAAGAVEPIFAPVDIGALVRELVAGADVVAGRRLQLDTAPLTIRADAIMVERIVENLLGNAAKHTPGDSRIWVRVERSEAGALISIEDDGPGVPAEERERIFRAFLQGEAGARTKGAGVGLALVARFAELHGGRAWIQERDGGGASFRVLLAVDPADVPSGPGAVVQPVAADPASDASQA